MSIKSEWDAFLQLGVRKNLHETCRREIEVAFYAGSISIIQSIQALISGNASDEEISATFGELVKESHDYIAHMVTKEHFGFSMSNNRKSKDSCEIH